MQAYKLSLVNPFDTAVQSPKLYDGKVDRSSGIRVRNTGSITCSTSDFTYIALFGGADNVISWSPHDANPEGLPPPFSGYLDTPDIKSYRLINAALRLQLLNSADEADGIWEAIRTNSVNLNPDLANPSNLNFVSQGTFAASTLDMPSNPTYQMGRLRDLHKVMFRLNWRTNEVPWNTPAFIPGQPERPSPNEKNFDVVVIRIRGRRVESTPSLLMYDTVAISEFEFKEGTMLNRMMTRNVVVPNQDEILSKLNLRTPVLRVV